MGAIPAVCDPSWLTWGAMFRHGTGGPFGRGDLLGLSPLVLWFSAGTCFSCGVFSGKRPTCPSCPTSDFDLFGLAQLGHSQPWNPRKTALSKMVTGPPVLCPLYSSKLRSKLKSQVPLTSTPMCLISCCHRCRPNPLKHGHQFIDLFRTEQTIGTLRRQVGKRGLIEQ